MKFSPDELALLAQHANSSLTVRHIGFYVSWIAPIVMFGLYGFWQQDFVAVTVALLGALGYIFWITTSQSTSSKLFQSIAKKIVLELQIDSRIEN